MSQNSDENFSLGQILDALFKNDSIILSRFRVKVLPLLKNFISSSKSNYFDTEEIYQDALIKMISDARQRYEINKQNSSIDAVKYILLISRHLLQIRKSEVKRKGIVPFEPKDFEDLSDSSTDSGINTFSIARILIAKNWTMTELGKFIYDFDSLYQLRILSVFNFYRPNVDIHQLVNQDIEEDVKLLGSLKVVRLRYNSPGSIDILGVGEIIKQVREFVFSMRSFNLEQESKKVEIELKKEEIKRKKLENAEIFLRIADKSNLPLSTINEMTNFIEKKQVFINGLIDEGKVTDIKIDE